MAGRRSATVYVRPGFPEIPLQLIPLSVSYPFDFSMIFRFVCLLLLTSWLLPGVAAAQLADSVGSVGPAVATVAGTATVKGSTDGPAATFNRPMGLAVDKAGNVYVADALNHTIRKITPDRQVTTYAGSAGRQGSIDGPRATALFYNPVGLAIGPDGTMYVTDAGNHTLRKITADGAVSTLAGTVGGKGSTDGIGAAARFNSPHSLALDAAGSLYVTDTENHTIRKITPGGEVTTIAGEAGRKGSTDGAGPVARFFHPFGVAVDSQGTLYVADNGNCVIRKITAAGVVSTLAGTAGRKGSTNATGTAARFRYPAGVATAPDGTLYVTEAINSMVRKVSATGEVTTLAGTPLGFGHADGNAAEARFNSPSGIGVAPDGAVYVADSYNYVIRVVR